MTLGVGEMDADAGAEGGTAGVAVVEADADGDAGEDGLGLVLGLGLEGGLVVADGVVEGEPDGVALWVGAALPWAGPTRLGGWTT